MNSFIKLDLKRNVGKDEQIKLKFKKTFYKEVWSKIEFRIDEFTKILKKLLQSSSPQELINFKWCRYTWHKDA